MKVIIVYLKQDLSRRQANESKDTCPPQASPNSQALAWGGKRNVSLVTGSSRLCLCFGVEENDLVGWEGPTKPWIIYIWGQLEQHLGC